MPRGKKNQVAINLYAPLNCPRRLVIREPDIYLTEKILEGGGGGDVLNFPACSRTTKGNILKNNQGCSLHRCRKVCLHAPAFNFTHFCLSSTMYNFRLEKNQHRSLPAWHSEFDRK